MPELLDIPGGQWLANCWKPRDDVAASNVNGSRLWLLPRIGGQQESGILLELWETIC